MGRLTLFIAIACLNQYTLAQTGISRSNNAMRNGDVLYKVEVNYVNPGDAGQKKVWKLGQIKDDSKDFRQGVVSSGDTIAVLEKTGIHHYLMHSDTLCYKGEQQRNAFRLYGQERPVLIYPFQYGDSISGHFLGAGKDENTDLSITGWGYTVADGIGILTDGNESFSEVLRLHLYDDYIESYENQLIVHILCHRYLWFCAGYRYPVMESFKRVLKTGETEELPLDSATYLYLPVMQEGLSADVVNESVRQLQSMGDEQKYAQGKNNESKLSSVQARLSNDGMTVVVDYNLSTDSAISIFACDILGSILGSVCYSGKDAGEWQDHITLIRKPVGNVLILNVQCGEDKISIKVNH